MRASHARFTATNDGLPFTYVQKARPLSVHAISELTQNRDRLYSWLTKRDVALMLIWRHLSQ